MTLAIDAGAGPGLSFSGLSSGWSPDRETRRDSPRETLEPPVAGGDELALGGPGISRDGGEPGEQKQENEMFVYSVSHDLRSPLINFRASARSSGFRAVT